MAVICPSVTATNLHQYREQVERVAHFATHIHLDFMDGIFAPSKSPGVNHAWWPHSIRADIHLMYKNPMDHIDTIIRLKPHTLIVHAEASGDFVELSRRVRAAGIKAGVALLADTPVRTISKAIEHIDHVLLFSGDLGHFGGKANLDLLKKVHELRHLQPKIEIGWDGGVNAENAKALATGGIDILNVGGYIQRTQKPHKAYDELVAAVSEAK